MLVIRDPQLAAFQRLAQRAFADRLIAIVVSEYPTAYQTLQESGTRQLVERAIDLSAAHGILTEGGVVALAGLMIQYGEAFERSPDRDWALGILAHPRLPGQLKVDFLIERMAARTLGRVVVTQEQE